MPVFIKPKFVHVQTGSGAAGLTGAAVAVVAVGAGVVAAWRWLAEPHPLLEAVIYSVFGVVLVASVVLVAVVLARQRRIADLRPRIHLHAASSTRAEIGALRSAGKFPGTPSRTVPPLTVADRRSAQPIVHNHLHLHGVTPEQVAQALAARQPAAVPVAIEADQD